MGMRIRWKVQKAKNTWNVTATLFNEPVKTLLGKECSDLLIEEAFTLTTMILPPLQAIKGKVKKIPPASAKRHSYRRPEMHGKQINRPGH
ncbi:hypothetical protein L1987_37674 [Smallanthus sonchifolius]|uniref:Uncharacterized protein n=1 Tax=Smallanthus sonchifolius TaxID=185202 RepID=A0ACB9HH31_9ASTR|nr:hypothetical protein L1987_37674 [Smallanthus sonchifolius]